jgi:hypothetical protein
MKRFRSIKQYLHHYFPKADYVDCPRCHGTGQVQKKDLSPYELQKLEKKKDGFLGGISTAGKWRNT